MNLNQMKMYTIVVELRGFSAASRVLQISPAAVSKQIRSLESNLGCLLIKRTSTSFETTDIGIKVYKECKRLLKEIDDLTDTVHSLQSTPSGNLKIFSTMVYAKHNVLPYIHEFSQLYPGISMNLDIADRIPDVTKENIDLCFGLIGHWDENLIQKKLLIAQPHIYAAPAYIEKNGKPETLNDLQNHKFICHGNRPNPTIIEFKNELPLQITPSIIVNDHEAFISFATKGLGLIVLFDFTAQALVRENLLVPILEKYPMAHANFNAYFLQSHQMKPASRIFLDFITSKKA